MDFAVGCPVAHRSWILNDWFDHIFKACDLAGVEPQFVFAGDDTHDSSFKEIARRAPDARIVHVPNTKPDDTRVWNPSRYDTMAATRNQLLGVVRDLNAPFFLSIDSDILLHPDALSGLFADMRDDSWDAIGSRCYMTATGRSWPSWGKINTRGMLQRYDAEGYFPVDVIMAIKFMRPSAYHVDYVGHVHGEDIGWSLACQRAGLKLAWDGRVASKHVLQPHLLHHLDPRVGY